MEEKIKEQELQKDVKEPMVETDIESDIEVEPQLDNNFQFDIKSSNLKEEFEKLKYNPYHYIKQYFEEKYPCIGGKVASLFCLLPISLIIPKLIINGREIRSHLNLLWLSPQGYVKSTISRDFANLTLNPLMSKKMTTPRLYYELMKRNGMKTSLIVEDIAIWFMDEEKIKFLEGASGDEESISNENMRNIKDGLDKHVNVICFCSGTCENINNQRLKLGILRRFSPLIVVLNKEEHRKVLNYIYNNVEKGDKKDFTHLSFFYKILYNIQDGGNKEIPAIKGFIFPEEILKDAHAFFEPMGDKLHDKFGVNTATESEQFLRFMACLSFLRIFEKKKKNLIQGNKIIIDFKDLEDAKMLIRREMSTKNLIYDCIDTMDINGVTTRKRLKEWTERRKDAGLKDIPNEAKFILGKNVK